MSVENQRVIQIKRSQTKDKRYFQIPNSSLELAMYNLDTLGSIKLYIYLCNNSDGYTFDLYPCDFEQKYHVARGTYNDAFKKLEAKGYLVQHRTNSNIYRFYEVSESDKIIKPPKRDVIQTLDDKDFNEQEKDFAK